MMGESEKVDHSDSDSDSVSNFDDMGLPDNLLRGIYGYGFESPSKIQQRAIVPLSKGIDVIAQSQSGTGKTGAFVVGALARVDVSLPRVQVLILEPIRELAFQSYRTLTRIGFYTGVVAHCSTGGQAIGSDISAYKKGVHAVVATPGRVLDLIRRGNLSTEHLRVLVIDEADEMLSAGFLDAIQTLMRDIPSKCQLALFSATLPPETLELTNMFMHDPIRIILPRNEVTLAGIGQYYVDVGEEEYKLTTLLDLFNSLTLSQCIIFCNSRRKADWLANRLNERDYPVACIHSDMPHEERMSVMDKFVVGNSRVLIATDLIARGIDVQGVGFVVNYDFTRNFENYIHRIGRGGRFGRKGVAINFVTAQEGYLLKQLIAYYDHPINPLPQDFVLPM